MLSLRQTAILLGKSTPRVRLTEVAQVVKVSTPFSYRQLSDVVGKRGIRAVMQVRHISPAEVTRASSVSELNGLFDAAQGLTPDEVTHFRKTLDTAGVKIMFIS